VVVVYVVVPAFVDGVVVAAKVLAILYSSTYINYGI